MSYQREREEFIQRMTREGLPYDVTRLLLREATGINRRAELACSSEAADRDRVPCPASSKKGAPCLCEYDHTDPINGHQYIPRIQVQDYHAEERIRKALGEVNRQNKPIPPATRIDPWTFRTDGDPRGYTLRVIPPSYAERNKGRDRHNQDAIGVPPGPSRLRW